MSMNIDQPLDTVIAEKRKNNRSKRGGRGPRNTAGTGGAAPSAPSARDRYAGSAPASNKQAAKGQTGSGAVGLPSGLDGHKIIVSNLPDDVTENQIRELFSSTVGPCKSVSLSYDSKGKSKGVATIEFTKRGDATVAYQSYNKRLVDGKRQMKVEIVVDPLKAPAKPLADRMGQAPAKASATNSGQESKGRSGGANGTEAKRGTGSKRGRGGRGGRVARAPKTVEDLDAEMEDYLSTQNTTAAA
ncbi:uncharacterized protein L969DRAFT_57494 [Mixia osmundae IAM 14324]|uniref:RRM domain-containing protein n=1 Tax=Mixia osmundae (strain CBS 9802 / IAM 14324 / JCM 22182 / KY 12970) TaxID=764103 RepID=G7E7C5_MIXOS|nr:uncharacterized protein L969DRAFT_57494 [Mixia osmundae IAM 14324]KEI42702.1 hypothetical protein L969DRAFT_57494 [Mixia osmundae IAM 14324]GAA98735.1 hypothetical protein E5Q_05423 [Mixia osmundae IAM 14324]